MRNDSNRTSGAAGGGGGGGGGGYGGAVSPLECDVGLGLNSEPSYPCKKMSLINVNQYRRHDFGGVYGNNGSQQFVHQSNPTNQLASGISFKSLTDGVVGASGKVLFTATQWQELERQTIIYKYIMASIPIPPQLLLPSSTQSNRTNTGIRFSNGSDPEPWRCRRTDGKKWRCAKDVGPNQKYCERHAHKTRSRSRKPVDTTHNPTATSSNQQTRCHEWFIKSSETPLSQSKRDDCSLSLSMQSSGNVNGNGVEFGDQESFQMAFRMLEGEGGECGDGFRSNHQWLNQAAWEGSNQGSNPSTPGGPLGEALCLGMSGVDHMGPNVASSYGSYEGGDDRSWFL
ncbi:unnamed protein product [Lactuca saligna]|uniref:Growth-regulating factor n=1 Tax=Lactuca saligna TaxID=75948 RepID=A0AA35ZF52_LACSI|nr:unnamed protein product [Lactuca saligna]